MKLSTKAQYGLKACYYLAENYGKGNLSISRLRELTDVSDAYLEQLMIPLRRAGLIGSERGSAGGYFLIDRPEDVTAGEVVRALEDNLEIMDCISKKECPRKEVCPTCSVWNLLYNGINDILDNVSLAQMIEDHRKVAEHECGP